MKKTIFDFQKEMNENQTTNKTKQMFEISNSNFFSVETKLYKWQCFRRCSLHQSELTASRCNVQTMLRKNIRHLNIHSICNKEGYCSLFPMNLQNAGYRTPHCREYSKKTKTKRSEFTLINDLLPS